MDITFDIHENKIELCFNETFSIFVKDDLELNSIINQLNLIKRELKEK